MLWSCTVFSNEITLYATEFLLPSTITPVAQKTIDTVKKGDLSQTVEHKGASVY